MITKIVAVNVLGNRGHSHSHRAEKGPWRDAAHGPPGISFCSPSKTGLRLAVWTIWPLIVLAQLTAAATAYCYVASDSTCR